MIELHLDTEELEKALKLLGGSEYALKVAVRKAIPSVAEAVRKQVLTTLDKDVALAPKSGVLIKRAVKAVQNLGEGARFKVASKHLLLGDYDVTPLSITAKKGVRVKDRKPFHYHLRKGGERFSSHSLAITSQRGNRGSLPFIAATREGHLRVMYRSPSDDHDTPLLAYAPSVQYHAATPEMEQEALEVSTKAFREALLRVIERGWDK